MCNEEEKEEQEFFEVLRPREWGERLPIFRAIFLKGLREEMVYKILATICIIPVPTLQLSGRKMDDKAKDQDFGERRPGEQRQSQICCSTLFSNVS